MMSQYWAVTMSLPYVRVTWQWHALVLYYVGVNTPGGIVEGRYQYMADLLALEATATGCGPRCFIPATPLSYTAWQKALAGHPDSQFVDYILSGVLSGVHIGVDQTARLAKSRGGNLPSVRDWPALVDQHIAAERTAGRLLGPIPPHLL